MHVSICTKASLRVVEVNYAIGGGLFQFCGKQTHSRCFLLLPNDDGNGKIMNALVWNEIRKQYRKISPALNEMNGMRGEKALVGNRFHLNCRLNRQIIEW